MSNASVSDMPFISSTGTQNNDPTTRKLIRSHVMIGKNKGKRRPTKRTKQSPHQSASSDNTDEVQPHSFVPRRVGSDWSFTKLADEIEPAALADILKFSAYGKGKIVPLAECVVFHKNDCGLLEPLAFDAAYLHAVAMGTHIYIGSMLGSEKSTVLDGTALHYSRALQLLRERLSVAEQDVKLSDSTILVVIALTIHARLVGDHEAAKHHVEGIHQIVDLRGGLPRITSRAMLAMEIFRCDIGRALETGSRPVFFANSSTSGSRMPFPEQMSTLGSRWLDPPEDQDCSEEFLGDIDEGLATTWKAMKIFCSRINHAARSKSKLPETALLQAMSAFMYRLLHSSFTPKSLDEAVRLGLVAFCSRAFLQQLFLSVEDDTLSRAYQQSLPGIARSEDAVSRVHLWLSMIGAVCVFNGSRRAWLKPVLRTQMEGCEVKSWSDLADIMNTFVWIGILFDEDAKVIFKSI